VAGYAVLPTPDTLRLTGLVAAHDGSEIIRQSLDGPSHMPRELGLKLADCLKQAGADRLMAAASANKES
jgi:porphobilinogen deaminase